ncbi:hypothetical protein [Streptomyces aquilus]|uniref:hypothetical protein n=1 Tax=Streptomyces aquilus TaxID=2548456 RepID=UPI003697A429
MKRATLALSLLSALSLTTLTACGGDDGGSDSDATTAGKPKATTSQAKEVSPAERLAKLMVTKAEVAGYNVEKPDPEYAFATSPDQVSTDDTACVPLAFAMNQLPVGDATADLTRNLTKNLSEGSTSITLATYATEGKAEAALTGLEKALKACGKGFTAKGGKNSSTYDSVTAEKPRTTGATGAVAFASTMTYKGVTHTMHTEAVRNGDTLAVYFAVNGIAIYQHQQSDMKLPAAVLTAQNAKLG